MNFLDKEFGKNIADIRMSVNTIIEPLRETVEILNKQDMDGLLSSNLEQMSDIEIASRTRIASKKGEARNELLKYLVDILKKEDE